MGCQKVKFGYNEAKKVRASKITDGKRMRIYFCPECGVYHLTSRVKNSKYNVNGDKISRFYECVTKPTNVLEPIDQMLSRNPTQ